jgi:poly(3-hydroxyalkanoate) synthetase
MWEKIKMRDLDEVKNEKKGLLTSYRIFFKPGRKDQKKNFPVLLQWTTYLRAWALHSTEETSLVNLFSNKGFDVYLVDWGDDSYFMTRGGSFEDYIQNALDIFDFVREHSGKDQIHYFGVCEGSVLAQIVASLRGEYLKTLSFNDLILNTDNMGTTNLLMDEMLVPLTNNPFMKIFSRFWNLPPSLNGFFLTSTLNSPLSFYLVRSKLLRETSPLEIFWSSIWTGFDPREIELSHHIGYAEVLYSNKIFKGEYEPALPGEGNVKIRLKNIQAPIFSIIGGMDNFTEPAGSFVERSENPFGTPYEKIHQEVIPTGHNFWLVSSNTDNVRKKWVKWMVEHDG